MQQFFDFVTLVTTKAFASKTLIVNWLSLVAGTITLWSGSDLVVAHPQIVATLGTILAGVNIVLRYATTLPLSEK